MLTIVTSSWVTTKATLTVASTRATAGVKAGVDVVEFMETMLAACPRRRFAIRRNVEYGPDGQERRLAIR